MLDDTTTDPAPPTERRSLLPLLVAAAAVAAVGLGALLWGGGSLGGGEADDANDVLALPLATPDGETITLADYDGTPLVVNFFAAWCAPCRSEMPEFEAVHQALDGEVAIVGVSRDSTVGAWQGLVEETGITFDTLYEGQVDGLYRAVEGTFMPTTAFIDGDGEVVHVVAGTLDAERLEELIDTHLAAG